MFTLKLENQKGEVLRLTQNESNYQVVEIDGLNPPKADVFTSQVAYMDGQRFKRTKLDMRNIVLTVRINGDVEENRLNLYRFTATGKKCKILYTNGSREVYIEGYAESNEVPLFTNNEQMQVSIVCPDPYFRQLQAIHVDISSVIARFEFFSPTEDATEFPPEGVIFSDYNNTHMINVNNTGETSTGFTAELKTAGTVVKPQIYNDITKEYLKFNLTMLDGERLVITTNKGHKTAMLHKQNGTVQNVISKVVAGSTWLQLETGDNVLGYSADSGADTMFLTFDYNVLYEGV